MLAYDPAVLIPVSIAASEPLPWEQVVAACRNAMGGHPRLPFTVVEVAASEAR